MSIAAAVALIRLEMDYEVGRVDEATYERRKAQLEGILGNCGDYVERHTD